MEPQYTATIHISYALKFTASHYIVIRPPDN